MDWLAILPFISAGPHTHTHTRLGFSLPSQNSSVGVFVNELDHHFNESIESILNTDSTCDAWTRFFTDPTDSNMPFCPLSLCHSEIRRAGRHLLPSVLATAHHAQYSTFGIWFHAERLFSSFSHSCYSLYSDIHRRLFDFLYINGPTLLLGYTFIPWRSTFHFVRFIFRSVRSH